MKLSIVFAFVASLSAQVAIQNVTIIDPRSGKVTPDATVLIEGSRITRVAPASTLKLSAEFRKVDGKGKYLIPGLWDAHVHLTKAGESSLALFLANGVTAVRDMGSDPVEVIRWRREIESGQRPGPRIKTAGRIFESRANVERMKAEHTVEPVDRIRQPVQTPDDVRKAVADLKSLGVDLLKVRSIPNRESLDALVEAARQAHLPLTGHAIGPPKDLFGKFQSIEHLLAYPPLKLTEPERRQLFRTMRDSGTWMSTTMVNFEGSILLPNDAADALLADRVGRFDSRRKYVGGYLLEDWREQIKEKKESPNYIDSARELLPILYRDIREMHAEGVKLLAGTDVAVAFIYPGFSLHDELGLYVRQIGLSPMETLRIATHNPAEFFHEESSLGGIAEGQEADLVLLDRNPLDDIRNTQAIRAVIARGKLYGRAKLNALLKRSTVRNSR